MGPVGFEIWLKDCYTTDKSDGLSPDRLVCLNVRHLPPYTYLSRSRTPHVEHRTATNIQSPYSAINPLKTRFIIDRSTEKLQLSEIMSILSSK